MSSSLRWIPEAIRFDQDPGSGSAVEQLTCEAVSSTNVYCEQRYASADGQFIAIHRHPFDRPCQIWLCHLPSFKIAFVAEGRILGAVSRRNALYYLARDPQLRIMRLDLADFSIREAHRFSDTSMPASAAFSPDERIMIYGPYRARDNIFALRRLNMTTGEDIILGEMKDIGNPHLQFEPDKGAMVMVQINRGDQPHPVHGGAVRGSQGATLAILNPDSGDLLPLPAGRPHTPRISGHETWVGNTGGIIFTAGQYDVTPTSYVTLADAPENERHLPAAAIYHVFPGNTNARVLAHGLLFNHIAASDDGKFFIADDHATGRIHVGSMATGKFLPLCESRTRHGATQLGHAHAYMTPNNSHVIFNSIVTGVPQVYAATLPPHFLNAVLEQR